MWDALFLTVPQTEQLLAYIRTSGSNGDGIDVDSSGQVTSHLTVEKPETLSMLQQDAPQLQRALDDAGLKTGNGGLQFSLRDQSSSGQNDGSASGRTAQRLIISDENTVPAAVASELPSIARAVSSSRIA